MKSYDTPTHQSDTILNFPCFVSIPRSVEISQVQCLHSGYHFLDPALVFFGCQHRRVFPNPPRSPVRNTRSTQNPDPELMCANFRVRQSEQSLTGPYLSCFWTRSLFSIDHEAIVCVALRLLARKRCDGFRRCACWPGGQEPVPL